MYVWIVAHLLGREAAGHLVIDGSHAIAISIPPFQSCALCLLPMSLVLLYILPLALDSLLDRPVDLFHSQFMSRTKYQTLPRFCV